MYNRQIDLALHFIPNREDDRYFTTLRTIAMFIMNNMESDIGRPEVIGYGIEHKYYYGRKYRIGLIRPRQRTLMRYFHLSQGSLFQYRCKIYV